MERRSGRRTELKICRWQGLPQFGPRIESVRGDFDATDTQNFAGVHG